jgi:hypothetical protein
MPANPYTITRANFKTAKFPFDRFLEREEGLAKKILGLAGSRVCAERSYDRRWPEALRPPKLRLRSVNCQQILEIERSRANIEGHGPEDKLTVTFRDVVRRGYFGLDGDVALRNTPGDLCWDDSSEDEAPVDVNAICAAMDYKQTWADVSRIRLVRGLSYLDVECAKYYVELVRQGEDGEETVRIPHDFCLRDKYTTRVEDFERRLSEELHLRRRYVDMDDQYVPEYAV